MTEQELATQIFPASRATSISSASIITATATADSSDGQVSVTIDGAQVSGANASLIVPTTLSVAAGDTVLLTLYGEDGHGKKAFVSGRVGESGGGGDPTIPGRVSTLESEMDTAQSDIATAQSDITTTKNKVNEVINVVNRRGFVRLYYWSGLIASCVASLWYNRTTGEVIVPIRIAGTPGAGWHAIGTGIPAALRPGALASTSAPNYAQMMISTPIQVYVSSAGGVGLNSSYGGESNDQGYLVYLVNADLNYTSTVSTVSSSIQPLTVTRAYAARVALGDGLDVTSDEFEKTARYYDEAYDVIFGPDDTSDEER